MKLNSLKVVQAKPTGSPANRAANSVQLRPSLTNPDGGPSKRGIVGEDRRRSQRVLLRVRAQIHVALHGKAESYDVTTLSVNHHGALVLMQENLPLDTRLVLENANTKERVPCKVVRQAREMYDGFQVPIEFDSPAPDFWGIAFPPSDWRPDES